MDTSENLNLSYILPSQAQKHVTHNDAIQALDALVHLSLTSMQTVTPPPTPQGGVRYLVPTGATGAWLGKDGSIAAFQDGAWRFFTPTAGWIAYDEETSRPYVFDNDIWSEVPAPLVQQNVDLLGVKTSADANNPFSVSGPGTLFTHSGAGHQVTMNKQSGTDTVSYVFKTNWSGRAEIGLTGDDDLHVKVSADGQSWVGAIKVDRNTGNVDINADLHVEGTMRLKTYTQTGLPSASTAGEGATAYVSDKPGGAGLMVSDGSVWR